MTKRFNPVPLLVILAVVIALPVFRSAESWLSPDRTASVSRNSAAPASAKAPKPKLGGQPRAPVGLMDASTNGLESHRLEQASALGTWLTDWEDLRFPFTDPEELRDLATSYRKAGYGSKPVRTLLRDAARLMERGEAAANERRYQTALTEFGKAADALRDIPPLLRRDLARAEKSSGARIGPQPGKWFDGYDHLFPVETAAAEATVTAWIDGDTVQTSDGRVRLIGVDTSEMSDQCSRAQAAKRHAETLAPPGSTIVLRNPSSVVDRDKYRRLLRYVDVPQTAGSRDEVIDVGHSQIVISMAVARYDSHDGYQWHPREQTYQRASDGAVQSDQCKGSQKAIIAAAATLANDEASPEYWRKRILGKRLLKPYASAKKHLPNAVAETREEHEDDDRRKRQREREEQRSDQDDSDSESGDTDTGSDDGYPGYTGPRCYAPGGKTWTPC